MENNSANATADATAAAVGNANNTSIISRESLDSLASWVSATVISAFFSSLERFSCVNLSTTDPDDSDSDEGPLAPVDDVGKLPV
ncbi:hypothetical protein HS088_TW15G00470 [Tripterygium wilfordii]|uniref:Uncharacterized protein n=1 Tax=Tripterygium wilfordii TaxID=458696 RepID=A0A7J7CLT0_TRIWF|nr:uncharacterized protein LOC120016301 [Tripterygium wilfordii]KAF5734971.1 hypothetical protein HS088_TW15G00470 [Tripterygium wilfordii]